MKCSGSLETLTCRSSPFSARWRRTAASIFVAAPGRFSGLRERSIALDRACAPLPAHSRRFSRVFLLARLRQDERTAVGQAHPRRSELCERRGIHYVRQVLAWVNTIHHLASSLLEVRRYVKDPLSHLGNHGELFVRRKRDLLFPKRF